MQEPKRPKGPLEPQIIFEDKDLIAIDKPSGLMVHGVKVSAKKKMDAPRAQEPTLADWLVERYPEIKKVGDDPDLRPGIVHRLDKETSGVMIVARNQHTFEYLKSLFQNHQIKKTYEALVVGIPKKDHDVINKPIGIKNGTLKRSVHVSKMAKEAVTEYRRKKIYKTAEGEFALLMVNPKTGRTHQIRVHLASIGHPIVGDRMYGKKSQPKFAKRLMLHARAIEFVNEHGERMVFESKLSTRSLAGDTL